MRFRWNYALLALAVGALLPGAASAEDDYRREMDEMRNMILQLQDTVQAQSGQIADQRQVIDRAGIEDVRLGDGSSSISSFFEKIEMNGWVAVSYFHNLNDLDTRDLVGGNSGGTGCCVPFHPDDNDFSFDQLWFEIGKPATPEDRAGFFAEIAFGRTAALLPGGNSSFGAGDVGGNSLYINSAYVEYMADFAGHDVTFKMGKFGTVIGAEVAQAPYNWNITRSNVYNLLQPIDHVGFMASTDLGHGFDMSVGVINDFVFAAPQPSTTDGVGFLGHLGYSAESWSASFNVLHANDTAGRDQPTTTILDLVASWDVTEKLAFLMNADLLLREDDAFNDDPNAWGVSLATRYAWTERLGTSLRYDFVDDDGRVFGCSGGQPASNVETECQIHTITLTTDFALTDALTIKGEVRYDVADLHDNSDDVFFDDDRGSRPRPAVPTGIEARGNDQVLFGVEAIYAF